MNEPKSRSESNRQKARNGKAKRVTILDVAEDAEVSFAAVSKVLRNAYGVSDSLRARVEASIKKLGYTPNTAARGMRGRTFVIGAIFPDFRNPFFSDIDAGISSALERTPYQYVIGISRHSNELNLARSMINMQLDGLIIIGSTTKAEVLEGLSQEIPVVTIGHHLPAQTSLDTVNNNDCKSSILVVRHLVGQGFKRIAMLSLDVENGTVIDERERGYQEEMTDQGLEKEIRIVRSEQILRDIQLAARCLLESEPRPEAIYCWTDYIALEVLSVAELLGLSVPGDVAIVGHDNTFYCDFTQNSLSSIDQSGEQLGLQAARLVIERIEGRTSAESYVVEPRLVARRSSRLDSL